MGNVATPFKEYSNRYFLVNSKIQFSLDSLITLIKFLKQFVDFYSCGTKKLEEKEKMDCCECVKTILKIVKDNKFEFKLTRICPLCFHENSLQIKSGGFKQNVLIVRCNNCVLDRELIGL